MNLIHKLMEINLGTAGASVSPAEHLIEQKHSEYARAAKLYRILYYVTRSIAGLGAGLLPFVVSKSTGFATGISAAIVVVTIVDMVFGPKERWMLFSKAADLLTIERLRISGEYDKWKRLLDLLIVTENAKLERLIDLEDFKKMIQQDQAEKSDSTQR